MYGKLFTQMYDGTLGTQGPWQALVTFQQLVILADQQGVVDMTPEALSRRTTIPIEIIQAGLVALEQPDPKSRTPDLEGRRIVRLSDDREWGWRVVNYLHYRAIRTADERREYMKNYQRERRARVKESTPSTGGKQNQPIAEVEAEADTKAGKSKSLAPGAARPAPKQNGKIEFDHLKGAFKGITESDELRWQEAYPAVPIPPEICKAAAWLHANPANRKKNNERFLVNWFSRAQERAGRVRR